MIVIGVSAPARGKASAEGGRQQRRRARVVGMDDPSPVPAVAEDALLGLLLPFWQLVIGAVVLAVLLLSVRRLARRGPSRMTTALLITAAAIAGIAALGLLFGS